MFTGLVETTGIILARTLAGESGHLTVQSAKRFDDLQKGESIAVNGACLTLEKGMSGGPLVFYVMRETFERTNLGSEPVGAAVNLERALLSGGRLGGHIVQGHVDAASPILEIRRRRSDLEYTIALPPDLAEFFVEKGSVAVDGISLTVESVTADSFRVGIIPTTAEGTSIVTKKAGSPVNLETDILGKYVISYLKRTASGGKSGVTLETLAENGFL